MADSFRLSMKRGRRPLSWLIVISLPLVSTGFQPMPIPHFRSALRTPTQGALLPSSSGGVRIPQALLTPRMSSEVSDTTEDSVTERSTTEIPRPQNFLQSFFESIKNEYGRKPPPIQVEDSNLLLYDTFLLINLVVSVSWFVVHRFDLNYLWTAFSEGCLLTTLWIGAGLWTGAFLNSAVDGHYGSADSERGGPRAAALLASNTFINVINLRLLFALGSAVLDHRPVGLSASEQLMPLEIGFGLLLMSCWRALHSSYVPRM